MNTSPEIVVSQTKNNPVPLVVESVDALKNFNIMPLIYPSGASGEFLASALVQTMPRMTLTRYTWYNTNESRANFYDVFSKLLNGGHQVIDDKEIINATNMFFYVNGNHLRDFNIALVHPQPTSSIDWLLRHLRDSYVLEIIIHKPRSRRFSVLAANAKINYPGRIPININKHRQSQSYFEGPNHLRVEWEDFLLTDVEGQFHRMEEFFGTTGDLKLYKELVTDYWARNQSLIDQLA